MTSKSAGTAKARIRMAAAACIALFLFGADRALHATPEGATKPKYGAALNFQLHCEGCHKADGSGQAGLIPDFRGNVARFLKIPEGREYLAAVPGSAQSLLTDQERADVLNWLVRKFDPANLPADFAPYTAGEVSRWRANALSRPTAVRGQLMAELDAQAPARAVSAPDLAAVPAEPPMAYAVCAACHTSSPDGSHGIGPNLRGVVDRTAGGAAGFAYSTAMKKSGLTWSRGELDAFLKAPSEKVPGSLMALDGVADPADRAAIVDYLASLR